MAIYSFGRSLRYIRRAQGISLRSVASAVNKTPTYISDIERGNNRFDSGETQEAAPQVPLYVVPFATCSD